jgi:phage FluMu protein gp41
MGLFDPRTAALSRAGSRPIDPADVIALLQDVYADGIGTREEAEELIAFDRSLSEPTPGWTDFFATSVADHLVRRQPPVDIVDAEKATWLIAALRKGRHTVTASGFAVLMRLIETAQDVPPPLSAFAIRQVRSAVIARRPASSVRLSFNRTIDSETAALVRRIVLGCPALSLRAVTRDEAEALFDLHDLTASGANDTDFDDLFFKAVSHHLIAETGLAVPLRSVALARQAEFPRGEGRAALLGPEETAWLATRIMRDGRPTPVEFELLQFFTAQTAEAGIMIQAA